MLVGYVSDEHHYALADVLLEFERGSQSLAVVRSTPRGAVYAELEAGEYLATLTRDGYGAKRVEMRVDPERPHRFRLLSDSLLGYMWPKWVRSGERGEHRVQFFLKGTRRADMRTALKDVLAELPDLRRRVTVDVDPLSVL